jgi:hypothetical protein
MPARFLAAGGEVTAAAASRPFQDISWAWLTNSEKQVRIPTVGFFPSPRTGLRRSHRPFEPRDPHKYIRWQPGRQRHEETIEPFIAFDPGPVDRAVEVPPATYGRHVMATLPHPAVDAKPQRAVLGFTATASRRGLAA